MLTGKCIIVGVTGGIAAYKGADLVSSLVKAGAEVHVIMTESACEFVQPLTFQTLSRNPVTTGLFEHSGDWHVQHVSLADRADLVVIAPATANVIGKVANGIADDSLTTTIMACQAQVIFAPAMNVHMYENQILQENILKLKKMNYYFIEPGTGRLACGYEGKGRMADVTVIMDSIREFFVKENLLLNKDLLGKNVLISAGGTREPIDPVRYIANRSSGKMGYAIAEKARDRGAVVTLISGPTSLDKPAGVDFIAVESAREMYGQVMARYQAADIIIKAAAVADYRPVEASKDKIKKSDGKLTLILEKNPDILLELGQNKGKRIVVGFAAETRDLIENARDKVTRKNVDFIVANDVTIEGAGFGTDTNIVKFVFPGGEIKEFTKMSKGEVAGKILDQIVLLQKGRN